MLFAKLLLSPYPHAQVRTSTLPKRSPCRASRASSRMDDLPAPADSVTDLGVVITADPRGERGLANRAGLSGRADPGSRAVDELTAADAIEKIKVTYEPLPHVVDPFVSLRPGGPNARVDGKRGCASPLPPPARLARSLRLRLRSSHEIKWTEEDFKDYDRRQDAHGQAGRRMDYGDVEAGFKKRRSFSTKLFHSEHQPPGSGDPLRHGLLAEREGLRALRHSEHGRRRFPPSRAG